MRRPRNVLVALAAAVVIPPLLAASPARAAGSDAEPAPAALRTAPVALRAGPASSSGVELPGIQPQPEEQTAPSGDPLPGTDPDDQPPPGATDGIPVGGDDAAGHGLPTDRGDTTPSGPGAGPTAVTQRYFGSGPWSAITGVARTTSRCSGLGRYELQAMIVAPIFGESSGGTSPSSAPAPMTLSRYDEWSGVRNGNSNHNANYGLYAFRNPGTQYKRVFWHPGIGIWQYDSAGVGADFTAAQRMVVSTVAADVATGMRHRWCNPAAYIGHAPPYTEAERRQAAWAPWRAGGSSCPGCERSYRDMKPNSATERFDNIHQVSMSVAGGAVHRRCWLDGIGTVGCWYIDPQAAQGSSWWADLTPLDGGSPTVAPTPISAPFYVIKRNGSEQRVWLSEDTGYSVDISGRRTLGRNARPRSNQPGSGVTWRSRPGMCDLTTDRGACAENRPPPGVHNTTMAGTRHYRPYSADLDGDGRDDLFLYGVGDRPDLIGILRGADELHTYPIRLGGDYRVTVADLDGNGRDGIVLYDARTGYLRLWRYTRAGEFRTTVYKAWKGLQVIPVDRSGTGRDTLLLYGSGSIRDQWWRFSGGQFIRTNVTINGVFQPHVGDFDGNGREDILWYAPGTRREYMWYFRRDGLLGRTLPEINGRYRVLVGDFDADGRDDVFWYGIGLTGDNSWFGTSSYGFVRRPLRVNGTFTSAVVNLPQTGGQDVLCVGGIGHGDRLLTWSSARVPTLNVLHLGGRQTPIAGNYSRSGRSGVYWYGPGRTLDALWWQ